ncbi:MAG: hypothetical protein ABI837_17385, partial [Acidobacteriota bacterium]
SSVPKGCDEGLAPAPPRVNLAELADVTPVPASMEAPPRSNLKSRVGRVQDAASRNARAEFSQELDGLKKTLSDYPAGGERDIANDVAKVYGDLDRLWSYEWDSPVGGFFDASTGGGTILRMMSAYPDFGRYIAPETINAGGTTVYPTREARAFLVAEAARRAVRVTGVRVTAPALPGRASTAPGRTIAPGNEDHSVKPKAPARPAASVQPGQTASTNARHPHKSGGSAASGTSHATKKPATSHATTKPSKAASVTAPSSGTSSKRVRSRSHKTVEMAAAMPKSVVRTTGEPKHPAPSSSTTASAPSVPTLVKPSPAKPALVPPFTPLPATATVASPVVVSPSNTKTEPPIPTPTVTSPAPTGTTGVGMMGTAGTAVATGTPAASSATMAPATDTSVSTTDTAATDSSTTDTAISSTAPAGRSMIIPIVLIVIGLGVLILLFRASS